MTNSAGRSLRTLLVVFFLHSSAVTAMPYTNLFVFGDSLADSGNNAIVFDASFGGVRTPTPLALPLIPTFPYASDRYSNGPVWVEHFAASLGLDAFPSLAGGTNFAFAGARIGPSDPSAFPYSLADQVNMFLGASSGAAPGNALYVIEGGGNDARDVIEAALGGADESTLAMMIGGYVGNVLNVLTTLETAGADQFMLWNIPDVGKIPAILSLGSDASAAASALALAMNQALVFGLTTLPGDITDGIHFFDAYQTINDIVGNPGAFGFTNVAAPCAMSAACIADPYGYFFWDGIHPTTAGHAVMAQLALATIPEPNIILLLALSLVCLRFSRRNRA